ncbi:Short chain dehydrogenase citE [Pseudocercospora fuligena]|uniref:Short chain dehydrogenase citE n=1 Tax=Pseudocercospora fuligena TaxID=685502 RepID=A0A8H6VJI6_9PEZI|nr:Short chain dehydrogenase citE [Pseudocercospora fuligena]
MATKILTESIPRPVQTYHRTTYPRLAFEKSDFNGHDKTVLITGGATGIGFATAKAFAKAGVQRIVIVSRSPEPQKKARAELEATFAKLQVKTHSASVTDYGRMAEILRETGRIDILVLSAMADHPFTPVHEVSTDKLDEVFQMNVIAQFDLIKSFLALPMPDHSQKTVLAINTLAAQTVLPGLVGYGSSKAAMLHVLQHFADQESTKAVGERAKFVSYHPGVIWTENVAKMLPPGAPWPEGVEWEDIQLPANFAVWLAGPQSDFLHGRFVWAQWDVEELIALKEKVEKEPNFLRLGLVL